MISPSSLGGSSLCISSFDRATVVLGKVGGKPSIPGNGFPTGRDFRQNTPVDAPQLAPLLFADRSFDGQGFELSALVLKQENACDSKGLLVGDTGIEPVAPPV
jgi:hypothetical protein